MTAQTATVLLVFGRGVLRTDAGYTVTPATAARVRAAADYVATHRTTFTHASAGTFSGHAGGAPLIVFSGGWAEACAGAAEPPPGCREGDLMLRMAHAAGLDRYADLRAESRSRSTLENLLHVVQDGLLAGRHFDAGQPLGIVSHGWHLPRVRFLAGKVLGLHGAALLDVAATGDDARAGWRSERAVHLASRLCFAGTRDVVALLRRERRLVASVRRAERLARRSTVA